MSELYLPYPSFNQDELDKLAEKFIVMAHDDGYTDYNLEQAQADAGVFLDARNAVNNRFVESIEFQTPSGMIIDMKR